MRIILKGAVFLLSLILCFIIIARIAAAPAKEKPVEDTYKMQKITSMNASGYSTSEIAEALGISTSTVSNYGLHCEFKTIIHYIGLIYGCV